MENAFTTFQKAAKLVELGRYKMARTELAKVLAEMPEFTPALRAMAVCFYSEGNFKNGLEYAESALRTDPNESENHYVMGLAYMGMEENEIGINYFEKAVELEPDNVEYFIQLARLYMNLEIYGKAKINLNKALEIEPTNEMALGLKSHYEHHFGRNEEADILMAKAIEQDPENVGLHLEMGNQALKKEDFEKAVFHYQQVMQKDPGNWLLRDRIITTYLGKYPIYNWLAIKFRPFFTVSYATLFFDLFLVLVGGLILREKNIDEPFYPYAQWGVLILIAKSIVFWLLRVVGHFYMNGKIWGLNFLERVNYSFYLHLNTVFALAALTMHILKGGFIWMATSGLLIIFSLISLAYLSIENEKKKKWLIGYLSFLYIVGGINFISEISGLGGVRHFPDILAISIFGPIIIWALWVHIKEYLENRKKPKIEIKLEQPPQTIGGFILDWMVLPLGFGVYGFGGYFGTNIVEIFRFSLIWGGMGILFTGLFYYFLKRTKSSLLNMESTFESAEDSFGRLARVLLSVLSVVVLIGLVATVFYKGNNKFQEKVAIVKHGNDEKKEKAFVWVKYKDAKVKLRPDNEDWQALIGQDSAELFIKKSIFNLEYVERIAPLENSK